MFLKSAGFKKLIKEAYSGPGLRMGNDGEGTYLSGGYWIIWVKNGKIPKKELAAIIELTGELPEKGEGFLSTKDGNQYELRESDLYNAMANAVECDTYLDITRLSFHTNSGLMARLLQEPGSRQIFIVNECFTDMVDNTAVDYDNGESAAEGPMIGPHPGIFWFNDTMAMHVMPRDDDEAKPITEHLERIVVGTDPQKEY